MTTAHCGIRAHLDRISGTLHPQRGLKSPRPGAVTLPARHPSKGGQLKFALCTAASSPVALQSRPCRTAVCQASAIDTSSNMATTGTVVEHIVLFNVKPETSSEATTKMISALRGLASLDGILGLYVGEAVKVENGDWTHALYGRYTSRETLQSYADSKQHMDIVINLVRPICSDILALDYETEVDLQTPSTTIAAACLVAAKAKEGSDNSEVTKALCLEGSPSGLIYASAGEGFAVARAKGFTWGFISAHSSSKSMLASVASLTGLRERLIESYLVVAIDCSLPPTSKI